MMDRQVKRIVLRAVTAAQPVAARYYHVCWWEQSVQCHHVRHTKEAHEVFFSAPGSVFLDELSPFQWRLLTTRIADFCEREGIALNLQSGARKDGAKRLPRRRPITASDHARLRALLAGTQTAGADLRPYAQVEKLERLLETARVVTPSDIPKDVVTMNSQVCLRNDEDDIDATLFLVFPADTRGSDFMQPKLSIFTQTGLSMLGRKVGDRIDGRLRILDVPYQPEAAGDHDL